MKSHARLVVIGGGIIGCNVLYHLTRLGWRDVVLVERDELTSGATWHAAGQAHQYSEAPFLARVAKDSLDLYRRLERETGDSCGIHVPGGLRIARHDDGIDEFKRYLPQAAYLGIEADIVGPNRVRELWPLLDTDDFLGALHTPDEGYVDATMTTNVIAKVARENGATIYRHTLVTGLAQLPSGEWKTRTDKGDIISEYVVNCAGSWGGEISALLGHYLPVMTMEHQYLVTEQCDALATLSAELPVLRDPSVPCYVRQERQGLMVSAFEHEAKLRWLDGAPNDFSMSLFPSDLERSAGCLETTFEMVPLLKTLGVRTVVNGPIPATPDLQGLLGPAHGLRNYFVCCGIHGGFVQGELSRHLAEWVVSGEPLTDLSLVDVRRFGKHVDRDFSVERLCAAHTMFALPASYPAMEPAGARPVRTDLLYTRLDERGAVFGEVNGYEVANWFAPLGVEAVDRPSFDRANWFAHVASECRCVRDGVGIANLPTAVISVDGQGATAVMERISASPLPLPGTRRLVPFLSPTGGIGLMVGIDHLVDGGFLLQAPVSVELQLVDWVRNRVNDRDTSVRNVSAEIGVLVLAGPRATNVLEALVEQELGKSPPGELLDARFAGHPLKLVRTDDIDDQAWEIHVSCVAHAETYETLLTLGECYGIVDFGMRAYDSLRLERGLPRCGVDYGIDNTPEAVGLGHLIATDKHYFDGKEALIDQQHEGPVLRYLQLDDEELRIDPWGGEVVEIDGLAVGVVTSGARAHTKHRSVAFAQLHPSHADVGTKVQVVILGNRHGAVLADYPLARVDG